MVFVAGIVGLIIGLPIGVFLATSGKGELFRRRRPTACSGDCQRRALDAVHHPRRRNRALTRPADGNVDRHWAEDRAAHHRHLIPFFARLRVESAIREIDKGLIEAARAMGATPFQIVLKVPLPEARPSILMALTMTIAFRPGSATPPWSAPSAAAGLSDLGIRFATSASTRDDGDRRRGADRAGAGGAALGDGLERRFDKAQPEKLIHDTNHNSTQETPMKKFIIAAAIAAFGGRPASAENIKVGVTLGEHAQIMEKVVEIAKTMVSTSRSSSPDYSVPNQALNDGETSRPTVPAPALSRQPRSPTASSISSASARRSPRRWASISKKVKSLDELKEGATVAILNDPTNGGRAPLVLASKGLIKFKEDAGIKVTVADIIDNPKKIEFAEIDAAQLPVPAR